MPSKEVEDILKKYRERLEEEFGPAGKVEKPPEVSSIEYEKFRQSMMPPIATKYEKLCNLSAKIISIKPSPDEFEKLQEAINTTHLATTPEGTSSFSVLGPLIFGFIGVALSIFVPTAYVFAQGIDAEASGFTLLFGAPVSVFFLVISLLVAVILMFPLRAYPLSLANNYRLRASNEMVLCIFYLVTYMRHTPNLELAIKFAADHLTGALALDLKKVLWDVETQKFSTVKDSMDSYLEQWRKYNLEFIEAFHLIESSLFESSESRRVELLEKSLDVILDETYEKMLHYSHNLKSPITMLHMLGIVLPVLGLVVLPLFVSFIGGVKWYYIAIFYDILLPIGVLYLGMTVLSQRPTGYGDTDVTKMVPALSKYKNIVFKVGGKELFVNPLYACIVVGLALFIFALLPYLLHLFAGNAFEFGIGSLDPTSSCKKAYCFLDYRMDDATKTMVGPFGIFSSFISLFFPLSIIFSYGLYKKLTSQNIIEVRERSKKLENEFASGIFQLGNRLGDGVPAESAFGKVAEMMSGTTSAKFFEKVNLNITKLGMSVEQAIFDPKIGAILDFPSNMITSSMKVMVQSVKKGPKTAAQALVNISRYIKELHRVDERLKDLLADVISSMKSQISVMTPAIAGIVVGITSMITNILGKLGPLLQQKELGAEAVGGAGDIGGIFGLGIPTYFFQIIVGVYVVEIIYILTVLVNGIENGSDKLNENFLLGKNLIKCTLLYVLITLFVMIIFNYIASKVLVTIMGGL